MLSLMNMLVNTGLGGALFGAILILQPPGVSQPSNNCTGSFTVAWAAVTGATSYKLEVSTDGGQTWVTVYQGPNTTFPQNGLPPGNYIYQVTALKGSKKSDPSLTGVVSVLQQGYVGATYRQGNYLYQNYRSGCTLTAQQIGKYGCTDPSGVNYDPLATLNEGCVYDYPCNGESAPVWTNSPLQDFYTATGPFTPCPDVPASGQITGISIASTPINQNTTVISATYSGGTYEIKFTVTGYWNWVTFYWTHLRG